jgi:hypothetical protein
MHWILQENLNQDRYRHDDLVTAIEKAGGTYSVHKVVPFSGEIIPDIVIYNPAVVMGPYSLCKLAALKGWLPGAWDVGQLSIHDQMLAWGSNMLNHDAIIGHFEHMDPQEPLVFVRPTSDSKCFAGTVMDREEFLDWQKRVVALGEDDGSGLRGSTEIMMATPKTIQYEFRFWVVNGKIVTHSRYRPKVSHLIPWDAKDFAYRMIDKWNPLPAYVMDVCLHEGEWKIVELNTLNACGFYAADLDKLVAAIEGLPQGD